MTQKRTLALIKPDAVAAGHCGSIIHCISQSSLSMCAIKMVQLSKEEVALFYYVHKDRAFFQDLTDFMSSGPLFALVLTGESAVLRWREMMGATNPAEAADNTIRKLFGTAMNRNATHGSDSLETAREEIAFFFSEREIIR